MKIYENEKIKWYLYIMPVVGIGLMILFTILKIVEPYNWSKGGYMVSMMFMTFWTSIGLIFPYFFDIKPRKKHKLFKELAITNGIKTNGKIIDNLRKTVGYLNGEPSSFVYYAEVELEDGEKIITDALLIDPEKCESNDVTVYQYEDKYYVTGFKISNENIESKGRKSVANEENTYVPIHIFQNVIKAISGAIFIAIMTWLEIKAADNVTRIILIPFFIAGMGVFLQGVLPLVFYKNQKIVANMGKKIYLFGFLLYWFGFLIVWDISAIRNNEIGMFLFSLIFWGAGIWILVSNFKKK